MRTILFRTILRQYDPSSLGCTTVACPDLGSNMTTACSRIGPAYTPAQSAPSMPSSSPTSQLSMSPESSTVMRLPISSSAPTMRPRGASVLVSYSTNMPLSMPIVRPHAILHHATVSLVTSSFTCSVPSSSYGMYPLSGGCSSSPAHGWYTLKYSSPASVGSWWAYTPTSWLESVYVMVASTRTAPSFWWSTVQISNPFSSPRIRRDCCLPSREVPPRITDV
mmetsp:Transcript_47105/g.94402  ORF Transcript_47105/g.94402 Transcript_47105/m.94402 type:complete len:222 (+) Transcript_47105:251-916(+)